MESILIFGILIVLWLQSLGTWLIGPMLFFSALGVEEFYLLVAPAVLWCLDPILGIRLGVGLMISSTINSILKLIFHTPRPYWYDERVQTLSAETSFGAPSGHAQNAVVMWGLIAKRLRRRWVWVLAIFFMLMIGISRSYLGVHFPSDVLLGWLIGALLLWLILRLENPLVGWIRRMPLGVQIGAILSGSLIMILAAVMARFALVSWEIPPEWARLAARIPGADPIDPLALPGVISPAAALFGLGAGAVLLDRRGWLDHSGPILQRLARYLVGLAGVLILWAGLDMIFPQGEDLIAFLFRYLRYALIGLWIAYLAPVVFFRLRLAKPLRK